MDILSSSGLQIAYLDPGSSSLVLQAIVGGAAGLLVFAKYMWDTLPTMRKRKASEEFPAP